VDIGGGEEEGEGNMEGEGEEETMDGETVIKAILGLEQKMEVAMDQIGGNRGSFDWDKGASNKGSWGGGDNWNTTNPPSNQQWSSSGGTKPYGENQPSTWNSSRIINHL